MPEFTLQQTLNIYNYIVKLYNINNEIIDIETVNTAVMTLNENSMPNNIVETLEQVSGVSKIQILDPDNTLILNSEKLIF